MIQLPTNPEIKTLKAFKEPNSLSIYAPYIAPNSSDNPNRTQLKNFLKEARQQLQTKGLDKRQIDTLLEPANKLLDSHEFRMNYKHSLAVFIGHKFFRYFHLPSKGIKSSLIIGKGFSIQPIAELVDKSPSYLVLLISHNGARLLKGNRYSIELIKDLPTPMKQDLRIDEYPKGFQPHKVAPVIEGKGSNRFHGQYNETQVDKDMLVKYFRHIDTKIQKIIAKENIPLIIAGVDYLLPLYRQVNKYPYLLANEIKGNLEHTPLDSIRKKAYKLLRPKPKKIPQSK
jgi:hypothetical protein